ncbi:MAG: hypothetical protein A2487_07590 [Candidatus Raymondbacteria bacterium RifOxyC12_full_50_8]|uniref:Uncharacterized protein n=1 Tax=Candidatus Raymondbacteria bacterium RIFOXYD12_FULL_49_13 TaxID=1817890 RepID=A0A1F7F6S1_UNCRA|nr:MAG: hypothetical protein A2248_13360 [Candidatus Raymondbacteria bacterium RIFOXYA2_FULL_49_16]OGJ95398.1 MAG: hypothetical protein A2350_20955 [Candidatus Raymondbacteria bacterium RifOxyB12_full_50_8]OGJ99290.1 MAG: hypothetical protein A2487_07590 [Candidatus Raymondbacteria bacterium RifOxyC12_full_50_8]OGK02272.1 MAG: hypothetical protein A2519_16475 [Candidatus Raymondbacteria bacterium RIFOXYD12_FULL_49_13]OGP45114.1 MAG: hypothetical protein A2324_11995 [Candidatus Raymondbacteria b
MDDLSLFLRFVVALAISVLMGLQREFAYEQHDRELPTGVRTFALMGLIGCSTAFISDTLSSPLPFIIALGVVGAFLAVNYYIEAAQGQVGLTTKMASIFTVIIGGMAYWSQIEVPIALGVVATFLLSAKIELHSFVQHLKREDVVAALKFAVISAVILPVFPDRSFGPEPFNIFNPFKLWLFVVFISGISFIGYVMIKIVGSKKGIGITGFFGGIASSTAVTLSFTQRSVENQEYSTSFAFAIVLAWTIMFIRLLAVVAFLNVSLVPLLVMPVVVSVIVGLSYCIYLFKSQSYGQQKEDVAFTNPFEVVPAVKFVLIFIVILLVSKVAQLYWGNFGVYISSFFAGLADVDAIAFSMAKLSKGPEGLTIAIASKAIVLAAVANTLVKGTIVCVSGAPALRKAILPGFILITVAATAVIFFM